MATTANSQTAAQILASGKNAGGQPLSNVQKQILQKQIDQTTPKATVAVTPAPVAKTSAPVAPAKRSEEHTSELQSQR